MHYDLVKNKEKGGKIALMSAITRGNGISSTNGLATSIYLSWVNINYDFYVNDWCCSKRAQAEREGVVNKNVCDFVYIFYILCYIKVVKIKRSCL